MEYGDETMDPGMGDLGRIEPSQLQKGWDVFGSGGDKVGDIEEVYDDYMVVSRGFLFTTERYIPLWAVTSAGDGRVYLNVTKDEIDSRGWDSPDAVARSTRPGAGEMRGRESGSRLTGEGEERMEIREEELRPRTREVEAGSVDIEREVVTETETHHVPVTREEVDVEYRPVESKRPASGDLGEDEIHVPVHEEEVTVDKETVVTGEVEVQKRQVQDTEEITGEVRKERPRIRREGDVDVNLESTDLDADHPHSH